MSVMNPSVLLIYTGGTIGMMEDPRSGTLKPVDFSLLRDFIPELSRFKMQLDWVSFEQPIDSSNADTETWVRIADLILEHYERYTGFVVLHGTDTMAYSASALSFMLENLSKPVVFTGSQLPLGRLRTDGKENLITAIEIAGMISEGRPVLNEVALYFEDNLYRGNRTYKHHTEDFDAFGSPNYPELATAGIHIHFRKQYLLPPPAGSFRVHRQLDNRISVLNFFPGMLPEMAFATLDNPQLKALVMLTYGSGNAPNQPWLADLVEHARTRDLILVNVTQCKQGFVEQGRYETSSLFHKEGVWSAGDMTLEASITKLMFLLGSGLNREEMEIAFHASLCGERTTYSELV